jgi:hypothetical protein
LLRWVRTTLKDYDDIHLKVGFKSDGFRNGKVFAGLINEFDDSYINYKALGTESIQFADNCKYSLETAEQKMGIPAILDYGMQLRSFSRFHCFSCSSRLSHWKVQ